MKKSSIMVFLKDLDILGIYGVMSQFLQMSQVIPTSLAFKRMSVLFLFYNKLFTGPNRDGFPGGSAVKNLPAVQETWVPSLGVEDPLEKVMSIYSSILAWRIPWTEEPGGLQSIRSQRVGHN